MATAVMLHVSSAFDRGAGRAMPRQDSLCCGLRIRGWRRRIRVLCSVGEILPVEECIRKMRVAVGIRDVEEGCDEKFVTLAGTQWFMEMKGDYKFTWCSDGRFHEKFKGEHVTVEWAHDGTHTWYADFAGRVTKLQLDSLELCLLTAWIRTGYWLTERGQEKLCIGHRSETGDLPIAANPRMQILEVRIREFDKVVACVVVDTDSWLPLRLVSKVCGAVESWAYSDWQSLEVDAKFPMSIAHVTASGAINSIFVLSSTVASESNNSLFTLPSSCFVPRENVYPKAQFDVSISPQVNVYESEDGHCLIRPLVDGKDVGYFLVDTGASGLTIAASQAEESGMEGFGEVFLLGVESRVKSRFVRGKEFQIGSLKILNPVYMETSVRGIVNVPEPIVGVCGFDLFFHCVVEMSMSTGVLSVFDPASYALETNLRWQSMILLDNVPHIPTKINGQEALLLLDTGAGGADVVLHARAARQYLLSKVSVEERLQWGSVKGMHSLSSGSGLLAGVKEMESLEVGGLVFEKPKALLLPHQVGNLDISLYTAGLLCGRLLRTCLIVLDYQKSRFALHRLDSLD